MDPEILAPEAAVARTRLGADDILLREGYRYEFFQAVRLLERMYPARRPVGHHDLPKDEVVRFRTHVSLGFPASEVHDVAAPVD